MSDEQKPPLTFDDVQEILRLLEQSAFDELQLDIGSLRLRLRRGSGVQSPGSAWGHSEPAETPVLQRAVPETPKPAAVPTTPAAGVIEVRSPMLGSFYRAPRPGAAPFVDVGTKVDPQMTIGIIEVMKLMNAVTAGVEGEICEICVEDGELVEHEQVLMRVSPL